MKQNIHKLNGLEFTHERDYINGQWVYYWYFRPQSNLNGAHSRCQQENKKI
jgi:hypothetical protein